MHKIYDKLAEKIGIKVNPELNVVDDLAAALKGGMNGKDEALAEFAGGGYSILSEKVLFDKKFLSEQQCWAKDKNTGEFINNIEKMGGNRLIFDKDDIKVLKEMGELQHFGGVHKIEDVEFVDMSDNQKLMGFAKMAAHELRHRKQHEMWMGLEGHSQAKLFEDGILQVDDKLNNKEELIKMAEDKIVDKTLIGLQQKILIKHADAPDVAAQKLNVLAMTPKEDIKNIFRKKPDYEQTLDKYVEKEKEALVKEKEQYESYKVEALKKTYPHKDTIKLDSEEGKEALEYYNSTLAGDEVPYLDRPIEKDAYAFQQKFAKENFPKMFGCTEEEALAV